MAELSSINFKKSNAINTEHNDRTLPPNYLLDDNLGVECNFKHDEARRLKNQIISSAMETYTARTGQKFQSKSYEWSAVVNLKPSSTMAELEKLATHLQEKYGFQCYQIAIHRDEGHLNEQGEKVLNHHAHLEFITLDKETGKNTFRSISKKDLRQIQSEVAEILQMQRGVDKRLSGAKRIEPRAYAKMKENEKKELQSIKYKHTKEISEIKSLAQKFVKERIEQERKAWIKEQGHTKEEYAQLRALKEQDFKTKQELENTIQNLNSQMKAKNEQIFALNQKIDELLQKNNESDLKAENELLKHENENLNFITEKMSDEITLLRHRQNERVYFIDEVKEIIAYKDELDKTSQNLNDDINLNRYENSIDKQKTLNEMLQKATKTKQMLEANPQLESFFSFEKYKKVYERFTKWLKDKGFPLERTNKNSIER
mgnify:CR=1 FL=1